METMLAPTYTRPAVDFYQKVMRLWQNQPYAPDQEENGFEQILRANPMLRQVLHAGPCVTYVLDVRTQEYVFMSGNVRKLWGYTPEMFTDGGLPFTKSLLHPDDSVRLWQLLRQVWDHLLALPTSRREDYQYNCEYRLRKANGTYVRLLEQNTILQTDRKGNITHLLSVCTDISNWKKGDVLTATIVAPDDEDCLICTSLDEHLRPQELLSTREKEVLKLISEGYSSKLIACELGISFHTVNTHRSNIIQKTSTSNTGELVQFAIRAGLI